MSYADRLQAFNSAIGDTQQHIENMKRTLTSDEMVANPVKAGLDLAGQVTGTGTAVLGLKRGLEEKGMIRKMAGAIHKAIKGKQSAGSSTADDSSGAGGDSSAGGAGDGGGTPSNPPPSGEGAPDPGAGTADPQPPSAGEGAGDGGAVGDAPAPAPAPADPTPAPAEGAGADTSAGADAGDIADNPFSFDNFVARMGQGEGQTARAGEGAGVEAGDLPSGGAGVDVGGDLGRNVGGVAEDAGDAGTSLAQTASGQASIAERAQQLQLQLGSQTTQDSAGSVQGLTSATTADNPAGQAHSLSQAQQSDADTARGQTDNPGANTDTDPASQIGGDGADQSANIGGRSAASGTAEEDGLSSGIKSALGVEEGIDEIAPEAGPFGWLLEGFSLLATLGTTIAGALEPGETKKSFIEGLNAVLESNASSITIYTLMMLEGTEFKNPSFREKHDYRTKYRKTTSINPITCISVSQKY